MGPSVRHRDLRRHRGESADPRRDRVLLELASTPLRLARRGHALRFVSHDLIREPGMESTSQSTSPRKKTDPRATDLPECLTRPNSVIWGQVDGSGNIAENGSIPYHMFGARIVCEDDLPAIRCRIKSVRSTWSEETHPFDGRARCATHADLRPTYIVAPMRRALCDKPRYAGHMPRSATQCPLGSFSGAFESRSANALS